MSCELDWLSAGGGVPGKLLPPTVSIRFSPPRKPVAKLIHVDDLTDMILQGLSDNAWEAA